MGTIHVNAIVSNPADADRRWEGRFLVDTGAFDSMAPAKQLRAIGIFPRSKRTYELADGTQIEMEIGVGVIEIMGQLAADIFIFGKDDVEPILGVTALESAGIEIDPRSQTLKRLPVVPLK